MENRNNNPIAEEIIHNNPTGYGLFAGIGDNFNSAAQAICELADDAISNLRANSDDPDLSMTIVVSFENLGDAVEIGVVDGGTGITNLDSALTIACRDGAQTPLNEHGFGLKHALASCDSSPSQQWSIRTRTKKDAAANQYREVTAPYSMGTSEEDQPMKVFFYPGAGGLPYPTGTAVTVRCPMAKFQTVKPDRKAAQSDFHHLVMYAIEELRYIYAGVLADTNITMKVLEVNGGTEKCHILKPLQPTWEEGTMKRLENVPYDLGGGQLTIHCRYGNILPTKSNAIYYKGNMASSGVELRINGRAIEHGLFDRVWGEAMAVAEAQSASVYRKASMLIKQIFADALTCDLIQVDPTTKYTFKRVRREKEDTGEEYLTDAQVATLLAAIKGIYPLETFVKLGLYAGLRREESLALQWDCVDLNADTPQIEVTRTCIFCHNRPEISNVTKTAAGHRNIPIPVPLFNHLKGIKKSVASDFVICNSSGLPLSETQFRNMWRKIKRRSVGPDEYIRYKQHGKKSHSVNREAGQTAAHNPNVRYIIDFPVKTHMLRKTYITNLIYSGVDVRTVMDYAGHKNPDITLKIYAQAKTAEKRTESAKQINEVFPSDPTT